MYIFDEDVIEFYHNLKMECPGLSMKGYLKTITDKQRTMDVLVRY